MDIYFKKRRWNKIFLVLAIFIGAGSIFYTNKLASDMRKEEEKKVTLWAEAVTQLASEASGAYSKNYLNFLNLVSVQNTTIPILIVDEEENIVGHRNFNFNEKKKDKYLQKQYRNLKTSTEPIIIEFEDQKQYIYHKESSLIRSLKIFPVFQLIVIIVFVLIVWITYNSSKKSEQNMVWVGMAKETAHQLGTPISSLMAWVELLKLQEVDASITSELDKDIERLQKIVERFSKIGSMPELLPCNIYTEVLASIEYLRPRTSRKIDIQNDFAINKELYIPLSSSLFSWVIENLIRNAVDALENQKGTIIISIEEVANTVVINISDNGKGISKKAQATIFEPGYTTKKRGWGLGLSLSKRIVENYHNGKIQLKKSIPNVQTTFSITLSKESQFI